MAKSREPEPEPEGSLESEVAKWLEETGYRLEFKTLGAFRRAGLNATMGFHVRSAEGKPREIDVSALKSRGRLFIRLLCECKYSIGKPWVLPCYGMAPEFFADWSILPKSRELHDIPFNSIDDWRPKLEKCWHFSAPASLAHTIVQAHTKPDDRSNRDLAFEALQKIANAA
jgi:hypothetical protein